MKIKTEFETFTKGPAVIELTKSEMDSLVIDKDGNGSLVLLPAASIKRNTEFLQRNDLKVERIGRQENDIHYRILIDCEVDIVDSEWREQEKARWGANAPKSGNVSHMITIGNYSDTEQPVKTLQLKTDGSVDFELAGISGGYATVTDEHDNVHYSHPLKLVGEIKEGDIVHGVMPDLERPDYSKEIQTLRYVVPGNRVFTRRIVMLCETMKERGYHVPKAGMLRSTGYNASEVNKGIDWLISTFPHEFCLVNSALTDELANQWLINHSEHCQNEWPHDDVIYGVIDCHWPLSSGLSVANVVHFIKGIEDGV